MPELLERLQGRADLKGGNNNMAVLQQAGNFNVAQSDITGRMQAGRAGVVANNRNQQALDQATAMAPGQLLAQQQANTMGAGAIQGQQNQLNVFNDRDKFMKGMDTMIKMQGLPLAGQNALLMERILQGESEGTDMSDSRELMALPAGEARDKAFTDMQAIGVNNGWIGPQTGQAKRDTEVRSIVNEDGSIREQLIDTQTGEVVRDLGDSPDNLDRQDAASAAADKAAQAAADRAIKAGDAGTKASKVKFDQAKDMRAEVRKEQGTYKEVRDAWDRVSAVTTGKPSAAKDLALVFNFMKMLDPGSVVRESEFKTAADARGWLGRQEAEGLPVPNKIRAFILKAKDGQLMVPEQRADFVATAKSLFDKRDKRNQQFRRRKIRQAKRFDLTEGDIFLDTTEQEQALYKKEDSRIAELQAKLGQT